MNKENIQPVSGQPLPNRTLGAWVLAMNIISIGAFALLYPFMYMMALSTLGGNNPTNMFVIYAAVTGGLAIIATILNISYIVIQKPSAARFYIPAIAAFIEVLGAFFFIRIII